MRAMLCYAMRHAESTLNANRGGGPDCDLTELGHAQAEAIAERLACVPVRAVYSSPYCRALRTAEPLAQHFGLPVLIRRELSEFNPSNWADLLTWTPRTLDEICRTCGSAALDPEHDGEFSWPPITETLPDVIERTRRFARFLKQRWTDPSDRVAVFGHGLPIARLIDAWLTDSPGPSFRFVIENAAMSALRYHDGVSSLLCLNEASHLLHLPPPAASTFEAIRTLTPRTKAAFW